MFEFLRIERPTKATLRPQATPASTACCMRCPFEATEETRIRPALLGTIWRCAGPVRVARLAERGRAAAVADLRELGDVGALTVDRRLVERVVAGVHDAP